MSEHAGNGRLSSRRACAAIFSWYRSAENSKELSRFLSAIMIFVISRTDYVLRYRGVASQAGSKGWTEPKVTPAPLKGIDTHTKSPLDVRVVVRLDRLNL
jgi:hypothetical protein